MFGAVVRHGVLGGGGLELRRVVDSGGERRGVNEVGACWVAAGRWR